VRESMWFQHDGAPPHFASRVRNWLDNNFSDRYIGRGGPIAWPPRSPDLTPLGVYLWMRIKEKVYATELRDRDDLINRTEVAPADIVPRQLVSARG
jgi:hypothetical protein